MFFPPEGIIYCIVVVQSFSSVQLCNPRDCSMPGFPVLHCPLEFAQTHVHWVDDAVQSFHTLSTLFSSCAQSFPASGSFPMSQLFTSGGQSIGASVSASVLPLNIPGWFPLGLPLGEPYRQVLLLPFSRCINTGLEGHAKSAEDCFRNKWWKLTIQNPMPFIQCFCCLHWT